MKGPAVLIPTQVDSSHQSRTNPLPNGPFAAVCSPSLGRNDGPVRVGKRQPTALRSSPFRMSEGLRLSAYEPPKVIWPVCNGPTTVQIESFARSMSDDLRYA